MVEIGLWISRAEGRDDGTIRYKTYALIQEWYLEVMDEYCKYIGQ